MSDCVTRLRIELDDTDPPIWRVIEVPAAISLEDLHRIVQAAMGWEDEHLFAFQVGREQVASRGSAAPAAARQRTVAAFPASTPSSKPSPTPITQIMRIVWSGMATRSTRPTWT
jgi:hypothetical protein